MSAFYKTLVLRLRDPGKQKRALLEDAMLRYTRALEALLRRRRADILALAAQKEPPARAAVAALADADAMRALDCFGVQPFKDSLKVDFTNVALVFLSRRRRAGERACFPCVRLEQAEADADVADTLAAADAGALPSARAQARIDRAIAHAQKLRPLYFGRYSDRRDYCLLYHPRTGRFFAKLHLFNSALRVPAPPGQRQELRVVSPGLPPACDKAENRRYLVLPLSFGAHQEQTLRAALENPRLLRTARLVRRESGAFDLLVSVQIQPGPALRAQTVMGLARGAGGMCCTVRGANGEVTESLFWADIPGAHGLLPTVRQAAALAVARRAQVVLEKDGGRGDGLGVGVAAARAFPVWRYARMAQMLCGRLVEAGLPAPALVSGKGLNDACPRCGGVTRKNRLTPGLFLCTACGYAAPARFVASVNLSARLGKYASDRIPLAVRALADGTRVFSNASLGFSFALPPGADETQLYYELRLFVKAQLHIWNNGPRYAMLCKLRDAPDLRTVIRRGTPRPAEQGF